LSASEGEDEDVSDEDEDMQNGDESPATDMSDEDEDDEDEEEDDNEQVEDKTELRKMMAEEQKTVAASLSQAAKADAEKGRAVKTQRSTFDSLLNTRIKLQKALIGTNTLTGVISESTPTEDTQDAFLAAETAAFTLWSTLNSLRETLESSRTGHKRKHATYTLDTPTEDLWNQMRSQELAATTTRVSTLEKWNQKARGASAITTKNKLNNSSANQSIVDVLQEQLHGDRLTKRARTPRSCAPLQLAAPASSSPSTIYDDADFYGLLLQSLLEQRSADSIAASSSISLSLPTGFQMRREAKTKKNVDTKASKGRKMRYTVHEKLENFMAPEDRNVWQERASDELFGSLFGRRVGLGEDLDEDVEEEGEDAEEEAGLMMFRS
jgi:protein AATF/BFR2